nr:quaternary ammonium compound efflux SMR transporter SugE [Steroidobacter denitrificans]
MSSPLSWTVLLLAGLFEIVWAIGLKYSEGFSRFLPSAITVLAMAISVTLLGWALRQLPVGSAYAVWVGIGAVGTALLGIVLFHESTSVLRLICIGLIVLGVIGLKFAG